MAKDLPSEIITQINAQQKRPRLVHELYLDDITLLFTGEKKAITFPNGGSTVYAALNIDFAGYQQTIEGQIGRVSVKFDNTDKAMGAYANTYDFEGKKYIIKRIYLDSSGNAPSGATNYNEVFNGKFEAPKNVTRNFLELSATNGKPLRRKALLDIYQRDCRYTFGDNATCNVDGLADLTSLKISNGISHSGSAVTLCSITSFAEVTDYWKVGSIDINVSGTTYNRKVREYNWSAEGSTGTIFFDVTLPVSVIANSVFEVKKGCDKLWSTCGASYAYGPLSDNTLNFGGFKHIGTKRESE